MFWILTVMLTYGAVDVTEMKILSADSATPSVNFATESECQDFLYDNKVAITDDILLKFRNIDGMELTGFDYFCEVRYDKRSTN
tara:strand:- start:146 stop:397 length:252 start_codon:yes stop_codon:yes gene_type:complete